MNNIVEQSHRPIKKKMNSALGFKMFESAHNTIVGVELWQMIKKEQIQNVSNMSLWEQFYSLAG